MIKERIIETLDFIEKASQELNSLNNSMKELVKEPSEENAKLHFVDTQYATVLYSEMQKKAVRLAELTTVAELMKIKLDFSEEIHAAIEGYIQQNTPLFVLSQGKIKATTPNLKGIIAQRAGQIDQKIFENYFEQIKLINQNE